MGTQRIVRIDDAFPPSLIEKLYRSAHEIIDSVRLDYFPDMEREEFQTTYQNISNIARVISVRFATGKVMGELLDRSLFHTRRVAGDEKHLLCPLFTLRSYHPSVYISEKHEKAFLQTEPHYDNGFGNEGVSIWVPFTDIDDETGGLCEFMNDERIENEFPKTNRNRYNFDAYLEKFEEIDPILRERVHQPHVRAGGALLHWNLIHGATKPRTKSRVSFNFRVVPESQLADKPENVQRLHRLYNNAQDSCAALHLNNLGDTLGAARLLKERRLTGDPEIDRKTLELSKRQIILTQSLEKKTVHWRDEFSWIL